MPTDTPLDQYHELSRQELISLIQGLKLEISRLKNRTMDDYVKNMIDDSSPQGPWKVK